VFVPENPTVFGFIGAGAGLFGDLANFLSERITAGLLMTLFAAGAGVAAAFCLMKALKVTEKTEVNAIAVGKCLPCDAFRASAVAGLIYLLLMLIGGGQSATEKVGETLGLIQKDVEKISTDVEAIRETTDAFAIIDRPKGAADHFHNAWVYQNMRRDAGAALASLDKLYAMGEPARLDAAELYFAAARTTEECDALIEKMRALGVKNRDAALLVVAARNAPDTTTGDALIAEARALAPDYPFVWWDVQRQQPVAARPGDIEGSLADYAGQKANIDRFIEAMDGRPAGDFFYLPQHQADFEALARQQSAALGQNIATFEGLINKQREGAAAIRARKEARPDIRFGWHKTYTKDLLEISAFIGGADLYAWRFNGGAWKEDSRIGLYHEEPRYGRFELKWRDRQTGEWFGPFVYDYAAE
jgi:hypothetical protein